jgi:hypothetical protein
MARGRGEAGRASPCRGVRIASPRSMPELNGAPNGGRKVTGFALEDTGVDVALSDGQSLGRTISSGATEDAV